MEGEECQVPKLSVEIKIKYDDDVDDNNNNILFSFEPNRPLEHIKNHLINKLEKLIIKNAFCSLKIEIYFGKDFCVMNQYELYKEVNETNINGILKTMKSHPKIKQLLYDFKGEKKVIFYCRLPERTIVYRENNVEVSRMIIAGNEILYDNPQKLKMIPIEEYDESNKIYKTDTMVTRLTFPLFHLYATIIVFMFKDCDNVKNCSLLLDQNVLLDKDEIVKYHTQLTKKEEERRQHLLLTSQKYDVRKMVIEKFEKTLSNEIVNQLVNERLEYKDLFEENIILTQQQIASKYYQQSLSITFLDFYLQPSQFRPILKDQKRIENIKDVEEEEKEEEKVEVKKEKDKPIQSSSSCYII